MKAMSSAEPVEILLVDDDPLDVRLTVETMKKCKLHAHLNVVGDGTEALDFLRRRGRYADAPLPALVLLDVNMPRKGGLEVLREIKQDPSIRHIPVVVLTTSESEQDVFRAYDWHANCFITKPVDLAQFTKVVNGIADFWFTIVKLPTKGGQGG